MVLFSHNVQSVYTYNPLSSETVLVPHIQLDITPKQQH